MFLCSPTVPDLNVCYYYILFLATVTIVLRNLEREEHASSILRPSNYEDMWLVAVRFVFLVPEEKLFFSNVSEEKLKLLQLEEQCLEYSI